MDIQDLTTRQVANALVIYAAALPYGADAVKASLMTAADESSYLRYANNGTSTRIDVLSAYGGRRNFQDTIRASLTFSHDADAPDLASAATGKDTTADSVGLFQQRPMYGYGSIADLMDPGESTRIFIRGSAGGKTRYFLESPATLTLAQRCQWVQGSEFPDGVAYAPMETVADQLIAHFGGIPTQRDWLDMVTSDEFKAGLDDVLGGVKGDAADTQNRVRGGDSGPGQDHENFDMLQDLLARLKVIEAQLVWLTAGETIPVDPADPSKGNYPFTKTAANFNDVRDLAAKIDSLAKLVATLVK